jgi:hypothetical protein
MAAARAALERVIKGHEPFPALVIDRHWTLLSANRPVYALMQGIDTDLLRPPINVLRLTLHPAGLAPRIVNWEQWRGHILERVTRSVELTVDPALADLLRELREYPAPASHVARTLPPPDGGEVFVPLQLATDVGVLSLLSTTTVFGTPIDVTLSEMALECFFPADAATADYLKRVDLSRVVS